MNKGNISIHSSPKPNPILKFFGCCGDNSRKKERNTKTPSLLCPTSQMDIMNPPNKPFKGSPQGLYSLGNGDLSQDGSLDVQKSINSIQNEFPLNEVFILGTRSKIVAYVARKKIHRDNSVQISLRESVSSLARENIKIIPNSNGSSSKAKWSNLVKNCVSLENKKDGNPREDRGTSSNASYSAMPENIGAYIASRLKCDVIIDVACGFGEITRHLASYSNHVLAIEKDLAKIKHAKNQTEVPDVNHKIDYINADFLKIKKGIADIAFINVQDTRPDLDKKFSLFKGLKLDLIHVIPKALEFSKGRIVLKLPGDVNLDELPMLFNLSIGEEFSGLDRFCIEIEEVLNINQEVENIIVYFGDCSSIEVKDEYEAVYDYLSLNQQPKWKLSFSLHVVTVLLEKIGIKRSLRYITEIEQIIANKMQLTYSFFDTFLDKAVAENIFTKQELANIIRIESKKSSSFIFSIANSYTSNLTLLQRGSSLFSSQYLFETIEDNRFKKISNKGEKDESQLKSNGPFISPNTTTQPSNHAERFRMNLLDQLEPDNNGFSDLQKKKFSLKDCPYDNSVGSQVGVSNFEPSFSSLTDGDNMKVFGGNAMFTLKMLEKKANDEMENTLTAEDFELNSLAVLQGHNKDGNFRKPVARSKSFRLKEVNGSYLTKEIDDNSYLKINKENKQGNKEKEENNREKKRKSEFFVKKVNAFLASKQE